MDNEELKIAVRAYEGRLCARRRKEKDPVKKRGFREGIQAARDLASFIEVDQLDQDNKTE